jgi:hypothetical protein
MPNKNSHLATARENRELAIFLLEEERSIAWSVTAACYSGLHLIEAAFAHQGEHCDDHTQRNSRLKNERSLQSLWRHYRPLYDASLRARYLTTDEGSAEEQIRISVGAEAARKQLIDHHLRQLEKSVAKRIGVKTIFE